MLRTILMFLGFIVAVLPYVGIPYDVTKWIWTIIGLLIVFMLFFSQKGKLHYIPYSLDEEDEPVRNLPVMHDDHVERPSMHIERDVVREVMIDQIPEEVIEREIRIEEVVRPPVRRRKKKMVEMLSGESDEIRGGE